MLDAIAMETRYHRESLSRLHVEYAIDPVAMLAMQARAVALGITFPASFIEWYGMRDGVALLKRNSNSDEPVPISKLGAPILWRWSEERDLRRDGLLPFMFENQGVCIWALRVDRGDDPPVVVARDPDFSWRPCAERFSAFICCQTWDHTKIWTEPATTGHRLLLQAQDAPLQATDLEQLRGSFRERPSTRGWPSENQYRFEGDDGDLLIWDGEEQADWWIAADNEEQLDRLVGKIWAFSGLGKSLWSNDKEGQRVLAQRRATST